MRTVRQLARHRMGPVGTWTNMPACPQRSLSATLINGRWTASPRCCTTTRVSKSARLFETAQALFHRSMTPAAPSCLLRGRDGVYVELDLLGHPGLMDYGIPAVDEFGTLSIDGVLLATVPAAWPRRSAWSRPATRRKKSSPPGWRRRCAGSTTSARVESFNLLEIILVTRATPCVHELLPGGDAAGKQPVPDRRHTGGRRA